MKVIIIGAGRMGSALAYRSVALGHDTLVLCRSPRSRTIRPLPKMARVQAIETTAGVDVEVDLVLIAAPAWADRAKETLISLFLDRIDSKIPVCSAVAYSGAPSHIWAAARPFAAFMCSPAIASTKHKPIVILKTSSRSVPAVFAKWLGPANLQIANAQSFDRLCTLFIATAISCEILRRIEATLKPAPSLRDKRFAGETLMETFSLLESFNFDPKAAFAACQTPRGRTYATVRKLLRA